MSITTARAKALRLLAVGGILVGVSMVPAIAYADGGDVNSYGGGGNNPVVSSDPGSTAKAADPATSDSLPITGGDVIGLALIGAGALVGGAVLVRGGRRKTVSI